MNITEDYCSYEIARLLKEKGFDVSTHAFYNPKKSYILKFDPCLIDRNAGIYVSAPTHQMAMKWLREEHNISVEPFSDWIISDKGWICLWSVDIAKIVKDGLITELTRKSYEEAVEAALKFSLENLI